MTLTLLKYIYSASNINIAIKPSFVFPTLGILPILDHNTVYFLQAQNIAFYVNLFFAL